MALHHVKLISTLGFCENLIFAALFYDFVEQESCVSKMVLLSVCFYVAGILKNWQFRVHRSKVRQTL